MKVSHLKPSWWDVVEAMAELVLLGQDECDLCSEATIRYLQMLDFRCKKLNLHVTLLKKHRTQAL